MAVSMVSSDVRAWPSLNKAARFLGVDPATLSRRHDLNGEHVGQQEIRISPATVVRLARQYKRRVLSEVLFDLIEHARKRAPDQVDAVDAEIEAWLEANPLPARPNDREDLLRLARDHLPPGLYRQVEQAVSGGPSKGIIGELEPGD
jgi:hypothetical protein